MRESVRQAFRFEEPEKIPVDFAGHRSSGIAAMAYARLKDALGVPGPVRVYDMVQQLAVVDEEVLDRFGVDTVEMGRGFCTEDADWTEWQLPDGTPCLIPAYLNVEQRGADWWLLGEDGRDLAVQRKGCLYFEQTRFPLADTDITRDDFAELEEALGRNMWSAAAHPGGHLSPFDDFDELAAGARRLRESTDRAIVGLFGGNLFELPQWLYGMQNYFLYMGLYPEHVTRLSEALCQLHLRYLERWLAAVGPHIDVVCFGDDLGGQNGPLLSVEMYRRFYKPCHARLWRRAGELADVTTMLHCCGGIRPLLEELLDAGIDAVNPVQVSAADMDAGALKRDFGDRMVFWGGGCDTHRVLGGAAPAAVADHVRAQAAALAPGGGFVFQQVHNIQANVPPENIIAMFDAVGTPA